jgi:hypothetical protein
LAGFYYFDLPSVLLDYKYSILLSVLGSYRVINDPLPILSPHRVKWNTRAGVWAELAGILATVSSLLHALQGPSRFLLKQGIKIAAGSLQHAKKHTVAQLHFVPFFFCRFICRW